MCRCPMVQHNGPWKVPRTETRDASVTERGTSDTMSRGRDNKERGRRSEEELVLIPQHRLTETRRLRAQSWLP
jgi:hypothetical protein